MPRFLVKGIIEEYIYADNEMDAVDKFDELTVHMIAKDEDFDYIITEKLEDIIKE